MAGVLDTYCTLESLNDFLLSTAPTRWAHIKRKNYKGSPKVDPPVSTLLVGEWNSGCPVAVAVVSYVLFFSNVSNIFFHRNHASVCDIAGCASFFLSSQIRKQCWFSAYNMLNNVEHKKKTASFITNTMFGTFDLQYQSHSFDVSVLVLFTFRSARGADQNGSVVPGST